MFHHKNRIWLGLKNKIHVKICPFFWYLSKFKSITMKFRVWPTTIYFRAFQRCGGYNSASLFPQVDVVIRHPQVFGICEFSQHHNHGRYFWTRVRCGGASFWIRPLIQQLFSCPSLNYSKLVKGRKKNLRERHTLPERLKKKQKQKNTKFQTFHDVSFLGLLSIHHPTPSTTPKPLNPDSGTLGHLEGSKHGLAASNCCASHWEKPGPWVLVALGTPMDDNIILWDMNECHNLPENWSYTF